MQKTRVRRTKIKLTALLFTVLIFQVSVFQTAASEEENVDTFNVHPENRWTETLDSYSVSVPNSLLYLNNVGDGSQDSVSEQRELRDTNGKIEIRFKFTTNASAVNVFDSPIQIELLGGGSSTARFLLYLRGVKDASAEDTRLYYDHAGGNSQLSVTESEQVMEGLWYVLTIAYDMKRSYAKATLDHDNGTKVFSYTWQDVGTNMPTLFNYDSVSIRIGASTYSSGKDFSSYYDYVKAPFKENEWTTTDSVADANWLEDSWYFVHVEDDVNDESVHRLTVPALDSVSGVMTTDLYDTTSLSEDPVDGYHAGFRIYAVDYDDGATHEILEIDMYTLVVPATGVLQRLSLELGGVQSDLESVTRATTADVTEQSCQFSVSLSEDRTKLTVHLRYWVDRHTANTFTDMVGTFDIIASYPDTRSEFIMETEWDIALAANNEIKIMLDDFQFTERDIFQDIVKGIGGFIGGIIEGFVNFLQKIFIALFRWLGDIFGGIITNLGALITAALAIIDTSLGGLLSVLNDVAADIVDIVTDVGSLAADFADFIISFAVDIADTIWSTLETVVPDLLEWLMTGLTSLITDLVDLGASIVFAIWDGFFIDVLGASEAPDFIAISAVFVDLAITVAVGLPAFAGDLIALLFVWFIFIPILMFAFNWLVPAFASRNIGEFVQEFASIFAIDLSGDTSILGVHVPIPFGIVWVFLLSIYAAGSLGFYGAGW